jgi:apoptosis-inducing factor 3
LSEDAPAAAAIHSFKAHVKEGKIHVTANVADTLKENKDRQAKLASTAFEVGQKGLVIIGGGSGALHSVESLREVKYQRFCSLRKSLSVIQHGYGAPITILSKETYLPIDRLAFT